MTHALSRRAALASGAALLATPFVARAANRDLVLYAAQHGQVVDMITAAFKKETGITVRVHRGDAPEIANQIATEGTHSPADVFFTENSPELLLLDERKLLAPVDKETLALIPAKWSATTGNWLGVLARDTVLGYNPKLIAENALPASLLDLAKPEWKGRVSFAPTDADTLPIIGAIVSLKGKSEAQAWLRGMKVNSKVFDDDEGVIAAVERGSVATGIINNYYWWRLRTERGAARMVSRLYRFAPGDVGNLINVSGAGVLASSKNPEAAQRLLAFLVSKPMQAALAASDVDFEYPLRPGVAANPLLTPLSSLHPPAITITEIGDDRLAAGLLQEAGLV